MHACCLDTYPPISYMQDTSHDIQRLVHALNQFYGENKVRGREREEGGGMEGEWEREREERDFAIFL